MKGSPKIAVWCKLIVFPGPCFEFWSLILVVANATIHVPEKRAASIRSMTIESPMLAIRRAPADHDTQSCCLVLTFCYIEIGHFYHGWYIVAIPDPEFVFDLLTWHRCNREQSYWRLINSGSQKYTHTHTHTHTHIYIYMYIYNWEVFLNLSFYSFKVRCPGIYLFFLLPKLKSGLLKRFSMPV